MKISYMTCMEKASARAELPAYEWLAMGPLELDSKTLVRRLRYLVTR